MNPVLATIRVLLFSMLFALANFAQASFSIMGAELTYRHLDSGKYAVYLKVYRDCNGSAVENLSIQGKAPNRSFTANMEYMLYSKDITGIPAHCPVRSKCQGQGTYPYGIEEQLWVDTLDFSSTNACGWILSFKHCCRSGAISTGMANQPLYIQTYLDKCLQVPNSTPQFLSDASPMMFLCRQQDMVLSIHAVDTVDQSDSIAYRFGTAFQDSGLWATYNGPFSPQRPISFLGFPNNNLSFPAGIFCDPVAGVVYFRPTVVNQVGVIVLEVLEYRKINGVMTLISTTVRDIQYRVIDCPNNNIPRIDPPYSGVVCIGKQLCFNITTDDHDPDDTVRIQIEHQLQNLDITYSPDTIKHGWAKVCWTPTSDDLNAYQHTFMVTASDNACSLPGRTSRTFIMFPRDNRPQAVLDAKAISCRELVLSHQINTSYPGYSFRYRVLDMQDSLRFESFKWQDTALLDTGRYRIELMQQAANMCENFLYDTVDMSSLANRSEGHFFEFCSADQIQLTLNGGVLNGIDSLTWSLWDGTSETDLGKRTKQLIWPGRQNLSFIARSDLGLCSMQDTVKVMINPVPIALFVLTSDTLCNTTDSLFVSDESSIASGQLQAWSWNGKAYSVSDTNYTLATQAGAWNYITLQVRSDKGCEAQLSDSVYVDGPLNYQNIPDQLNIQQRHPAQFELISSEPISAYRWERKGWKGTSFIPVINGFDIIGMDKPKLEMLEVQPGDSGSVFRCIVTRHGCLDTSNEAVLGVVQTTTSVYFSETDLEVRLYPNPASSDLHVLTARETEFEILDQLGKVLLSGQTLNGQAHVNINCLASGVYFFRIAGNHPKMLKFSKY